VSRKIIGKQELDVLVKKETVVLISLRGWLQKIKGLYPNCKKMEWERSRAYRKGKKKKKTSGRMTGW